MNPLEASKRFHWIKYDEQSNTIEMYLDHYMLSGARLCESRFYLQHIAKITPRYDTTRRKPWFLDFGEYLHWCLETFYKNFKVFKQPPMVDLWLEQCKEVWLEMDMDWYGSTDGPDNKKFNDIGGWPGVAGLLTAYYAYYMDLRVRVIDTEITFGHNKEVFLGEWYEEPIPYYENGKHYKCYLTGRIDLLVDNGYKIGPVDHKSTHRFDGFEHNDFNPHDGICGYILAINEILKKYYDPDEILKLQYGKMPQCTGGWIYHIQNAPLSTPRDKTKKQGPRFKTTPIDKTLEQLQDFKDRNLSTFKRIAELVFNDKTPEWNTTTCNNIFFRPCEYKPIHEQPSSIWPQIIGDHYDVGKEWDTREHGKEEVKS